MTKARPFTIPTIDSTAWPAWMRQAQVYPTTAPDPPKPADPVTDPNAALLAQLAALQADLERQRQELEALKKRPAGTIVVQPQQGQAAKVAPAPKPNAAMLFVAHELKDPSPKPSALEYTLAPGATKLSCIIETAINSDVEGYFTAKVSTNVYTRPRDAISWCRRAVPFWGMIRAVRSSMAMNGCPRSASRWPCPMGAR
jgi:hypothetical protein